MGNIFLWPLLLLIRVVSSNIFHRNTGVKRVMEMASNHLGEVRKTICEDIGASIIVYLACHTI
jgi:hypothetical protein